MSRHKRRPPWIVAFAGRIARVTGLIFIIATSAVAGSAITLAIVSTPNTP
ncbi:hypothetical protein [Streptantibioticus ferralitis]|uniref:Uncharacterized protein n=1 Tax=Streptantibioticus ferralitis TaxID=236510 RepID=A0ABT5YUR9_9ACTN|nr:hypothetical protein [Streptantibioticus ferralitis]MDF2255352.1 hypothetical protein [Streptantibioticus ferralitis]